MLISLNIVETTENSIRML